MVQVNGIARRLTQRFSRDLELRVKYSTLCPSRRDSPSEASRAIPTSRGFSETGSKGRDGIMIRLLFAHGKLRWRGCQPALGVVASCEGSVLAQCCEKIAYRTISPAT